MPLGVGILGFAHGHVNAYCSQWAQNDDMDIRVRAAWDHDAARLESNCRAFGLEACADPESLLARSDIQAVVIAAETSMHADLTERAAAAGKSIVVQKPMALTLPEADRMVAAVQRAGVPFSMAWQMRVDPQNIQMRDLIQSGELGRVFMVRRRHGLSMCLDKSFTTSWHVAPKYNRDIFADDASHPIDLIHWMLGVPETITAEIETLCHSEMPCDNGIAVFRYSGGPLAEVVCSFSNPAGENTTEIVAEKGSVIQNYGDGVSCNVPRAGGPCGLKWFLRQKGEWVFSDIESPTDHGARIHGLARPLSEFLHGRRPPIATAEEGRTSLRMLLACYVSSHEGRRVRFDDDAIARV